MRKLGHYLDLEIYLEDGLGIIFERAGRRYCFPGWNYTALDAQITLLNNNMLILQMNSIWTVSLDIYYDGTCIDCRYHLDGFRKYFFNLEEVKDLLLVKDILE